MLRHTCTCTTTHCCDCECVAIDMLATCCFWTVIKGKVKTVNIYIYRVSQKKCPLWQKYDTIAPNLEINEIHFLDIDPDVHADSQYKNSIDRSRNVWVISAWKRRTSFAPTQGLHFSSLWNVLSDMRFHCFNELWMWKISKNIMLHIPVAVLLLLFIFFIHMTKYVNCSICVYLAHNH